MKTLVPAWSILCAAVTAFAAPSTKDSSREIVDRIPAGPDVVLDWNAAVSDHFEEFSRGSTPHIQARVYVMAHLAMRDAIAAVTREARRDEAGAIAKSAASAAAYDVLVALRPAGLNRFAALHGRHIAAIANGAAESHGRRIGQRTAASILSSRVRDGWPVALSGSTAGEVAVGSLRTKVVQPTPFFLKRAQQFEPEHPYLDNGDGVLRPNGRLRSEKIIGTPADVPPDGRAVELWLTDPIVRWNRAAQSLALQQPQELHARARLFALLGTAMADALLSATYWNEAYREGRADNPITWTVDAYQHAIDAGAMIDPTGLWRAPQQLSGFPAVPAALAGVAEAILRSNLDDKLVFALTAKATDTPVRTDFTSLRSTARQCAWAALMGRHSTYESCVAGYDLGRQIGAHVLKQQRQ